MSAEANPVFISLKPRYADHVFSELKKVELRRRIAPCMENRNVFVYVSSPVKKLRGGFRVGHVWKGTPQQIWNRVSQLAGLDKHEFDAYYADCSIAYVLKIVKVWEYQYPANLNTLRTRFPGFVVPQSWRYVRHDERRSFQKMKLMSPKTRKSDARRKSA